MNRVNDIIDFWFEGVDDSVRASSKVNPFRKWFYSSKDFDKEIKELFFDDLSRAYRGNYNSWKESSEGCLALILLLDQLSRSIYRNESAVYKYDSLAQEISMSMLEDKKDKQMFCIYRIFIYMPLVHSEELVVQDKSVNCFRMLLEDVKKDHIHNRQYFQSHFDVARRYREDIKTFGYFPKRRLMNENLL